MFKGLGSLANLAGLFKEMQQMGSRLEAVKDRLRAQRVTGTGGGGMVAVEANGLAEVLQVSIDPTLFERNEREMIEDLVRGAINQALEKSRELHANEMRSMTDGIDLPGVQDAISTMFGESK